MHEPFSADHPSSGPAPPAGGLDAALLGALRTQILTPVVALRDELRNRRTPPPRTAVALRLRQTSRDARDLLGELYPRSARPTARQPPGSPPRPTPPEAAERRALAEDLHDEVIQPILVARQELLDPAAADAEAVSGAIEALDDAQRALRHLMGDVDAGDPPAPADADLHAALMRATARRGPAVQLAVAPDGSSVHDALIVQIVREAYANATLHAAATRVAITVARERERIVLDVRDNGRGIDPEQVRSAVRRGHIGLATVTERVAAAGGNFDLRNQPTGGAHLRVVLPLTAPHLSGEHPVTVVLADDHPRYRRTLARAIGRCPPLRVIAETSDGEQALQAIRRLKPDVALLDLRMPQLDALEVVRQVRQTLDPAATRLIVMTADPHPALDDELHAAGADLLVDKASSRAEVCAALLASVQPAEICCP